MTNSVKAVLFDLGGVLIELGPFPVKEQWLGGDPAADTSVPRDLKTWLKSDSAQSFETGLISAEDFARDFIADNGLKVSRSEFLTHFTAWPIGPYKGVFELLNRLKGRYTLAAFSNTNELHWDRLLYDMGLESCFDSMFASHLIGKAKPDKDAFLHVVQAMGFSPAEVYFIDDSAVNVDAAIDAGLLAGQAAGLPEVVTLLESQGFLDESGT